MYLHVVPHCAKYEGKNKLYKPPIKIVGTIL